VRNTLRENIWYLEKNDVDLWNSYENDPNLRNSDSFPG
jgi:hypothetical protein